MARKKVDEPVNPAAPPEISLLRVEERTERVSITPEQKVERMTAAAAVFSEAAVLDTEVSSLSETLKAAKQRAAAKHDEGERIIMDAQQGTMAQPYPVIVERHPTHPAEMIVWRVPDGVMAAEVLDLTEEGDARLAAREAQGCTLVETRAMWPEELALSAVVDHAHQNPTLPIPLDPVEAAEGLAAGEQPTDEEIAAGNAPGEDVSGDEPDGDEPAAPKKKGAITCPFILEQPDVNDPARDVLCGAAGAGRRKGFCAEHYELTGGATGNKTQKLALSRRTARKQLAEEAKGAAREEAAGEVDEPDEDEDDDGAGDADAEVSIQ